MGDRSTNQAPWIGEGQVVIDQDSDTPNDDELYNEMYEEYDIENTPPSHIPQADIPQFEKAHLSDRFKSVTGDMSRKDKDSICLLLNTMMTASLANPGDPEVLKPEMILGALLSGSTVNYKGVKMQINKTMHTDHAIMVACGYTTEQYEVMNEIMENSFEFQNRTTATYAELVRLVGEKPELMDAVRLLNPTTEIATPMYTTPIGVGGTKIKEVLDSLSDPAVEKTVAQASQELLDFYNTREHDFHYLQTENGRQLVFTADMIQNQEGLNNFIDRIVDKNADLSKMDKFIDKLATPHRKVIVVSTQRLPGIPHVLVTDVTQVGPEYAQVVLPSPNHLFPFLIDMARACKERKGISAVFMLDPNHKIYQVMATVLDEIQGLCIPLTDTTEDNTDAVLLMKLVDAINAPGPHGKGGAIIEHADKVIIDRASACAMYGVKPVLIGIMELFHPNLIDLCKAGLPIFNQAFKRMPDTYTTNGVIRSWNGVELFSIVVEREYDDVANIMLRSRLKSKGRHGPYAVAVGSFERVDVSIRTMPFHMMLLELMKFKEIQHREGTDYSLGVVRSEHVESMPISWDRFPEFREATREAASPAPFVILNNVKPLATGPSLEDIAKLGPREVLGAESYTIESGLIKAIRAVDELMPIERTGGVTGPATYHGKVLNPDDDDITPDLRWIYILASALCYGTVMKPNTEVDQYSVAFITMLQNIILGAEPRGGLFQALADALPDILLVDPTPDGNMNFKWKDKQGQQKTCSGISIVVVRESKTKDSFENSHFQIRVPPLDINPSVIGGLVLFMVQEAVKKSPTVKIMTQREGSNLVISVVPLELITKIAGHRGVDVQTLLSLLSNAGFKRKQAGERDRIQSLMKNQSKQMLGALRAARKSTLPGNITVGKSRTLAQGHQLDAVSDDEYDSDSSELSFNFS